MMVIAVATPIVYVMRVYGGISTIERASVGDKLKSPYDYAFTVILTEDTATIEAFAPPPSVFTLEHKHAIFTELRRLGAKVVRWIRIRNDVPREVRITL